MTDASPSEPTLSIVTTLYNSAATIESFYIRARAAALQVCDSFEIVIVDDGSPDDSLARALRIAQGDPCVKVIELSRNFGHHRALMTGLMHARGQTCLLIDSDLEEDPALLGSLWQELHSSGADVVYGYQAERSGDSFRRITGHVTYWIMDLLIPYKVPRNLVTLRLMKRAYVQSLLLHREQQTAIGGLWLITGYHQRGMPINKLANPTTSYSFIHRVRAFIEAITSFSDRPLVAIFYLGLMISTIATLFTILLILRWAFGGAVIPGWVSVMISVWILGGISIFSVGVVGLYVSKIFLETKGRPYTIVRNVHHFGDMEG